MIIAIKDLNEGINEFEEIVPSENYKLPESENYPNSIDIKDLCGQVRRLVQV